MHDPESPATSSPRPVGRPRKLPFPEREQLVLDAATALFAERGSSAVPMALIAERAGVNKALLYEHFTSKEALFLAVARRARDHFIEYVARHYGEGRSGSARARIRIRYHAFVDFAAEQPDAVRILRIPEAAQALDGTGRDALASGLAATLGRDLAEAGLPSNELPHILAAMFVGMAGSVIRRGTDSHWDPEAVVDLLTDFTIAGMTGVRREVLERADRTLPTT